MIKASPFQQRLLAILILGTVTGLVALLLGSPLVRLFHSSGSTRQAQLQLLKQERSAIAQKSSIEASAASARNNPLWQRLYKTQALDKTVLELQGDLRAIVTETSGMTPTIEKVEPVTEDVLTRVGVRLTFSASIDRLASTLERLQQHAKLLRIEQLIIQAPDFQPPNTNPALSVQVQISGFMLTKT